MQHSKSLVVGATAVSLALGAIIALSTGVFADCDSRGVVTAPCNGDDTAVCVGCWANAGGNCKSGQIFANANMITQTGPGKQTATPDATFCSNTQTCGEFTATHGSCILIVCNGDPNEIAGCSSCTLTNIQVVNQAIFDMSNTDSNGNACPGS